MGLLSTSGITNSTVSTGTTNQAATIVGQLLPKTSATLTNSLTGAVSSASTSTGSVLSSVTGSIGSAVTSAKTAASGAVSKAESALSSLISPVTASVTSELASFTSTFSKEATSLSNQISSYFTGVFSDSTTAKTTSLKTGISDPVKTLLTTSNPSTAGYKFTTGSGTPTQIALGGTKSVANGTSSLTTTQTQTLMNRYNLDDLTGLTSSLTSSNKAAGVSSVYTNLFSSLGSSETSVTSGLSKITSTATSVPTQAVSALSGVLDDATLSTVSDFVPTGTTGATYVSINDPTKTVYTKDATTTAANLNKISSAAKSLNCDVGGNYTSVDVSSTLSSVLLNAASQSGLTELVSAFLQCESFVNSKSDSTLTKIISTLGGSQPATSNVLISAMSAPSTLNQQSYTSSVLTDNTLTSADVADVTKIFDQIGATPSNTYLTSSSDTVPTYDLSLAAQTQTPILNAAFPKTVTGNSVLSDFLNSTPTTVSSNGTLSI